MAKKKSSSSKKNQKILKTKKELEQRVGNFLADKPLWVWWVSYVVLTLVFFLVFFLVITVFGSVPWWGWAIIILVIGFVWGSIKFSQQKPKKKQV